MAMSRSFGGTLLTTRLPMLISPAVMFSSPAIIRSSVDLPHPDGPTSTTNSPSSIATLTPWRTSTAPNAFLTSRMATGAIHSSRYQAAVVSEFLAVSRPDCAPAKPVALGAMIYPTGRSSAITLPSLGRLPGATSCTSPRSLVTDCRVSATASCRLSVRRRTFGRERHDVLLVGAGDGEAQPAELGMALADLRHLNGIARTCP